MKFYTSGELDWWSHPISYFKKYMREENVSEMILTEMKIDRYSNYRYCKELDSIIDLNEESVCGKQCEFYEPKNKVSGVCKHLDFTYDDTGKQFLLKFENGKFTKRKIK